MLGDGTLILSNVMHKSSMYVRVRNYDRDLRLKVGEKHLDPTPPSLQQIAYHVVRVYARFSPAV